MSVESLGIAIMPETSDFGIVEIRNVRSVEVDERQPDGWVGGIAAGSRGQRFILGEVACVYERRPKRGEHFGLEQHARFVDRGLRKTRPGAASLVEHLIPITIG